MRKLKFKQWLLIWLASFMLGIGSGPEVYELILTLVGGGIFLYFITIFYEK